MQGIQQWGNDTVNNLFTNIQEPTAYITYNKYQINKQLFLVIILLSIYTKLLIDSAYMIVTW